MPSFLMAVSVLSSGIWLVDCDDGAVHLCDENGTKTGQSRTLTEGQGPKILAIGMLRGRIGVRKSDFSRKLRYPVLRYGISADRHCGDCLAWCSYPLARCGREVWMYHHRPLLIWNKGGSRRFCLLWPGPSIPTSLKHSGARAPVVRP
jgi:hypothetical protein